MVKYEEYDDEALDAVFSALADPTRRAVLAKLDGTSLPVTELAAPHDMSLPGFMKHLRVLEDAGLIARTKEGRVVSCVLSAKPMKKASDWLAHYEKFWNEKLDSLARFLYQQEELQTWNKQTSGRPRSNRPKNPSSGSSAPSRSRPRKSGGRGPTPKR